MNIIAIMPIKMNNERLSGKNTRLLGGKPLLTYALDTLLNIKMISKIYVYCSDDDIIPFLPNGIKFLKRPKSLDLPESNFTQIFEAFSSAITADIYIYAHATAPFIRKDSIEKELDEVLSGHYDSAFCAEKIQDFLWSEGKPLNFDPQCLPRSQDLPLLYRETSGVYVFKKEVFDRLRSRVGKKPYILEVNRREALDINTKDDFEFAELLLHTAYGIQEGHDANQKRL